MKVYGIRPVQAGNLPHKNGRYFRGKSNELLSPPADSRLITAIHFVVNCVQTGTLTRTVAMEKLKKLAVVGRYRLQILQDAERRICGGIS